MASEASTIDRAIDHHRAGRTEAAERLYREILEDTPDDQDALHLLGVAACQAGRYEEAVRLISRALAVDFTQATFYNSLGAAYQGLGRLLEAEGCFRRSIMLDANYAEAHSNLGMAVLAQGLPDKAIEPLERAVLLAPGSAAAHNGLGAVLRAVGRIAEATASYRRAIEADGDHWEAHNNLGNILKDQCRTDDAVAHYRRAGELEPQASIIQSNLLCALQYRPGITLDELARAHAVYDKEFGEPLRAAWKAHDNDPDPERRLKIGFLSPDLHRHPVGSFLVQVLESIDREQAETFCYSTSCTTDDLTERLQAAATQWRDAQGANDEQLANTIRDDRIDILFDLAGHTGNNRLPVLARKPAPIQVSWGGYAGTTGLQAIDYLLADPYEVPPGAERHYQERVLRMPQAYVCYEPPAYAPDVAPLAAEERGFVTFASFNNPAKIGPEVAEVWSRILARVPGSLLILKYKGMNDPAHADRLSEVFAAKGIEPSRVSFLPRSSNAEVLEHYNGVDIALDPFPYSGGLTTLEALWMGVPVVTWPGETFAGRHALTYLTNVGLTETIARDPDDYVEVAAALAGDLPGLAVTRAGLRDRMAASPICDGGQFTADLLQLLRGAWKEWVERQANGTPADEEATCPEAAEGEESGKTRAVSARKPRGTAAT